VDLSHFVAAAGGALPTIHSEAHVLQFGTAVILSMASAFAIQNCIPKVFVALHKEDAEEATEYAPAFLEYMNSGIKLIGASCEIIAPYHELMKKEVLKEAVSLGMPIELSWSCVSPVDGVQSGGCGACRARQKAMKTAGLSDPTKYAF